MHIVCCGGGNAVHVLASILTTDHTIPEHHQVSIWTLVEDEVVRFTSNSGIQTLQDGRATIVGQPVSNVTSDPAQVIPQADVILLALPAFVHNLYLKALAPYLDPDHPVLLGSFPGKGGFDWWVNMGASMYFYEYLYIITE